MVMSNVSVQAVHCQSCSAPLVLQNNFKGRMVCSYCNSENVVVDVVKNIEIVEKENINSGISLDMQPIALHDKLVEHLSSDVCMPLDIFDKAKVVREQQIYFPAYCFYCTGTLQYVCEVGNERIRQEVHQSKKGASVESYIDIEYTQLSGTANITTTLMAIGSRKSNSTIQNLYFPQTALTQIEALNYIVAQYPNDKIKAIKKIRELTNLELSLAKKLVDAVYDSELPMPATTEYNEQFIKLIQYVEQSNSKSLDISSELIDIELMTFPDEATVLGYDIPELVAFNEFVKPQIESALQKEVGKMLNGKEVRNLTFGGSNIQKGDMKRVMLGFYNVTYEYDGNEYTLSVTGNGKRIYTENLPIDEERSRVYKDKKSAFEAIKQRTGWLTFYAVLGIVGAVVIISNWNSLPLSPVRFIALGALIAIIISCLIFRRKRIKAYNIQRATAGESIESFVRQFTDAKQQFSDGKRTLNGIYKNVYKTQNNNFHNLRNSIDEISNTYKNIRDE